MPDLPAMSETPGLEGFEVIAWVGMFAPAKTPKDVVDKLNAVVRKALAKPEVKEKIASFAAEAAPGTPERAWRVRQGAARELGQEHQGGRHSAPE